MNVFTQNTHKCNTSPKVSLNKYFATHHHLDVKMSKCLERLCYVERIKAYNYAYRTKYNDRIRYS